MNITNEFTEDEVSLLLDIAHEYYAKDESILPIIQKLWKMERILDIRTDKQWRGAE